ATKSKESRNAKVAKERKGRKEHQILNAEVAEERQENTQRKSRQNRNAKIAKKRRGRKGNRENLDVEAGESVFKLRRDNLPCDSYRSPKVAYQDPVLPSSESDPQYTADLTRPRGSESALQRRACGCALSRTAAADTRSHRCGGPGSRGNRSTRPC